MSDPVLDHLYVLIESTQSQMRLDMAMFFHEDLWGVPFGPTLTMVCPKEFRGLKDLVSDDGLITSTVSWKQPWQR